MKEIKAYECDFCGKHAKTKSYIKKHELRCFFNPKSKSCVTCDNYSDQNYDEPRSCNRGINIKFKLETSCYLYKNKTRYNGQN